MTNCYEYWGALGWQEQQVDTSGAVERVRYNFDQGGRTTRMFWPYVSGQFVNDFVAYSDFDGLGRPRSIRNCVGGCYNDMVKYKFLGGRVAEKEYPQSDPTKTIRQTFWSPSENNYDAFGRLLRSHAVRDPDGSAAAVMDLGYQYDDDGNPTWRFDALQNSGATQWSQKYEYDRLNRLSCAMQGAVANWQGQGGRQSISPQKQWVYNDTFAGETYSLDAMGNFVTFYNNGTVDQRTHNTSNEITARSAGWRRSTFDPAGDMTFDGEHYNLGYDFRHRLVQVKRQDDTLFVAFSYGFEPPDSQDQLMPLMARRCCAMNVFFTMARGSSRSVTTPRAL